MEIAKKCSFDIQKCMKEIDWNLARAFCFTANAGSLSAAARKLGLTQPTLSRQVAALERALGVTLFERVGKKLVLTETGLSLLEHAQAMVWAADSLSLAAVGRAEDIHGRVSISATDAIAVYLLPDIVARIRQQAPQITLVVVASNAISDLRRREADIAIRHVQPTEPDLIGRRVRDMTAHFYAAEAWVAANAMPRSVTDLSAADLLAFEPIERFVEHLSVFGFASGADQFRIVSENGVVVWEMVRRGLGIGAMLSAIADRTPGIVRVLSDIPAIPVPVWLVTHRELHTSRRVRVVFDILAEALAGGG